MRALFGCLAVLLGAVSVLLAARYGYKGADTLMDGLISAVVFGLIALCAFLFDAAAVRLWFMGHRLGSTAVGLIASAALVVTFTNSLGAIAGRADATQAERARLSDAHRDNRAELKRLQAALAALPAFTPTDGTAVEASRRAADTAAANKVAECGNGDPRQRGPNCRQRELDEGAAAIKLANATAAKSASDRAAKLEAEIVVIRAKLGSATIVQDVNPLGSALEQILGAAAARLTAWQQAIVAAVFELCLVGVMVIYELLGHPKQPQQRKEGVQSHKALAGVEPAKGPPPLEVKPLASPARTKTAAKTKGSVKGSVKRFVRDHVIPADGERIEIKALMRDYRAWCGRENLTPLDASAFLDELEMLCHKLGIEIQVGDDQRVYCLNAKMTAAPAGKADPVQLRPVYHS